MRFSSVYWGDRTETELLGFGTGGPANENALREKELGMQPLVICSPWPVIWGLELPVVPSLLQSTPDAPSTHLWSRGVLGLCRRFCSQGEVRTANWSSAIGLRHDVTQPLGWLNWINPCCFCSSKPGRDRLPPALGEEPHPSPEHSCSNYYPAL